MAMTRPHLPTLLRRAAFPALWLGCLYGAFAWLAWVVTP